MVIERLVKHVSGQIDRQIDRQIDVINIITSIITSIQDRVLLEVKEEGDLRERGGDRDVIEEDPDPYLVVHPNYVIET